MWWYSHIDLVVIAPEFDCAYSLTLVERPWRVTEGGDHRIEPIPCGEQEWEGETNRPIIELAGQEGVVITI